MYLAIIGEKRYRRNGMYIIGSHVDSPRLDLKPNPLRKMVSHYFKTHYYGGIKISMTTIIIYIWSYSKTNGEK